KPFRFRTDPENRISGKCPKSDFDLARLRRISPCKTPAVQSRQCAKITRQNRTIFALRILTDAPSVFSGIAVFRLRRKMMTLGLAEGLHAESGASARLSWRTRHQGEQACRQKVML